MFRNSVLFALAIFGCVVAAQAQMVAKSPFTGTTGALEKEIVTTDWSIYADEDSSTYFIDFEQLAVNVNKVMVKNAAGQVIWQEEVFDLPVNSIYELDFSGYSSGEYTIELQAFTGVIRKAVRHKV
ncbi:MAG: hypothetical protein R2795_07395 [Saprospiraceae bacterium]